MACHMSSHSGERQPIERDAILNAFHESASEYLAATNDQAFLARGFHQLWHRPVAVVEELMGRLPPQGVFVDIGTGHGIVPRMVSKLGAGRVIVIDREWTGGAAGVEALSGTEIETVLAAVGEEPVPLPDGVADVAFAGDVIEHIPHSPRPFMHEIKRLLRPGGWHVQDTPNAVCLRTRLKMIAGIHNWATLEGVYDPDINVHHHKEYSLNELVALFERAGFVEVTGRTYEHFWQKSLRRWGTMQTMGAPSGSQSQFGIGFNFRHPYEYARILLMGVARLAPSLRSSLIVSGRRPPG